MSATCYSDEYDDVMISGKWFLVFHHCAGIAAPGAPGILSQDVTLAALPIRLQPPFHFACQFPLRSEHLAHDLTNIHQGHVPLTSFKPALKRQFCS